MKKIKLSIIIPAYNVEAYLTKCLNSILTSEQNIEIILIDDGSNDSTPVLCDDYANNHNNVKVVHIDNGGQSRARNIGIDISCGEYIMFMDSDDYLDDDSLIDKIIYSINNDYPDMILYGYKKLWEKNNIIEEKKEVDFTDFSLKNLIKVNYFKACPWDKVIKRKIIEKHNMKFPEYMLSEDIDWCAQLINNIDSSKIKVINDNSYIYVQHKNSTSKTVKRKHINDIYNIIFKYIPSKNIDNEDLLSFFAYEYCMTL